MTKDRNEVGPIRAVLFSGGRGSRALARALLVHPDVDLTLAVNGYDDGKSTGEVRRFLGDALGPSDFRKNAATVAEALASCEPELIELLDARFPDDVSVGDAIACVEALAAGQAAAAPPAFDVPAGALPLEAREALTHFRSEMERSGKSFAFGDCAIGNLVFAGCFVGQSRDFNRTIDAYGAMLGVPAGVIENVTDGENAFLVARNRGGELLASEEDLVDAQRRNIVEEIWLVSQPIERLDEIPKHESRLRSNPRLLPKIEAADLILYAPGTQHSSLLPSYLTEGLADVIAGNVRALKVLVTNIERDVEIPEASALDLTEKALFHLRSKGTLEIPAPCLISHSLLNDANARDREAPYVPLGRLQSVEDPRLVRIADYEHATEGGHDAGKVLLPFIDTLTGRDAPRVAAFLYGADSNDKLIQSSLEAHRSGLRGVDLWARWPEGRPNVKNLPDEVLPRDATAAEADSGRSLDALLREDYDYVILFDSSGMYRGEDVVNVAGLLLAGTVDAAWGSRRLSASDIRASYQLRYRKALASGAASWVGSHLLSLTYLLFHGRYVTDVLSGVRGFRAQHLPTDFETAAPARLNQKLLSRILASDGLYFETPIRFFSMSPDHARRTTVTEGLQTLASVLGDRVRPQ
jgi:2-phospho-L-lactate transferase/gluconeogenesis factor (CofD/UPF0052 family)